MFFAAEHYTNIKIMQLLEQAISAAMIVQVGVANGTIKYHESGALLNNIVFNATKKIALEKCLLKCEPSKN